MITFEEFKKLDLRVAKIIRAERIPKTDKLLKVEVETNEGTRTVVAGMAEFYTAAEMIGKYVILLANLQPVRLRGVESNGMLLATTDKATGNVVLLTTETPVQPGSRIS